MRAVVFSGSGGNEVVGLVERADPECGPEDVVVSVRYAGVNPADVFQRLGRYPAPPGSPPDIPGLEVSGTVVARGGRVSTIGVGDRVFGLVGGGGLADRVAVHARAVAPVPDVLDDAEAAAVPEAFITAHDALRTRAELAPAETVLVHGASGGVGTAAVQVALATGARVLGVVRSNSAAEAITRLGAEPIRSEDFCENALVATSGRGVDVVLELVGGSQLADDLMLLAPKGRIVVVSVAGGDTAAISLLQLMQKRAALHGSVLRSRPLEERAAAVRAFEREVLPFLGSGRIRPLIDSVFPATEAGAAFDRIGERGKVGKVLLEFA
jgi:NADPH2:quinone reductase